MKLSEFFNHTGEPFFYYPGFVHRYGLSVNATVLLCFIGWRTFEDDKAGWRAITTDEITSRTGLTWKEQKAARRLLVEAGMIEEVYARLEHTLKFRFTAFDLESSYSPLAQRANGHVPKGLMAISPKGDSSNEGELPREELGNRESSSSALAKPATAPPDCLSLGLEPSGTGSGPNTPPRPSKGHVAPTAGQETPEEQPLLPPEAQLWNRHCGGLSKVLVCSTARLAKLRIRRTDTFWMENLPAAIAKIVASDFCNGRGGKGWTADFDFLLQPNTVAKVMEGKYDNRRAGGTDRPGSANVSETIKPKMLN